MAGGFSVASARYANAAGDCVLATMSDGSVWVLAVGDPALEGVAVAPFAEAPSASRTITPREWRNRFTAAEKGAITVAAAQSLAGGDPTLQVFLDDLAASQVVELDHPDLLAGVQLLLAVGLLTQARAKAVLA